MRRVLSFRQEFSEAFHHLLHDPLDSTSDVVIEISEKHFPLFLLGRQLHITRVHFILHPGEAVPKDSEKPTFTVNTQDVPAFSESADFGKLPTATLESTLVATLIPDFIPSQESVSLAFNVKTQGGFGVDDPASSDTSALDANKITDIYLALDFTISSSWMSIAIIAKFEIFPGLTFVASFMWVSFRKYSLPIP